MLLMTLNKLLNNIACITVHSYLNTGRFAATVHKHWQIVYKLMKYANPTNCKFQLHSKILTNRVSKLNTLRN